MASDDEAPTPAELRLNSLDRWQKVSSTLILEQHSHCEVPAGCGGVVLRWRRPGDEVQVMVRTVPYAEEIVAFDGEALRPRQLVRPGLHQLVVVCAPTTGRDGSLIAMVEVAVGDQRSQVVAATGMTPGWRARVAPPDPPHDPLRDGFAQPGWAQTEACEAPAWVERDGFAAMRARELEMLGASWVRSVDVEARASTFAGETCMMLGLALRIGEPEAGDDPLARFAREADPPSFEDLPAQVAPPPGDDP